MINRDVIITCAVTGSSDSVGKNPAVPVTPKEIAAAAIDAAKAGAAAVPASRIATAAAKMFLIGTPSDVIFFSPLTGVATD